MHVEKYHSAAKRSDYSPYFPLSLLSKFKKLFLTKNFFNNSLKYDHHEEYEQIAIGNAPQFLRIRFSNQFCYKTKDNRE